MSEWKQENRSVVIEQPWSYPDPYSISLKSVEVLPKIKKVVNLVGKND